MFFTVVSLFVKCCFEEYSVIFFFLDKQINFEGFFLVGKSVGRHINVKHQYQTVFISINKY